MSRQLISFDWAIKRLLRNKANFGILEGFMSLLPLARLHFLHEVTTLPHSVLPPLDLGMT